MPAAVGTERQAGSGESEPACRRMRAARDVQARNAFVDQHRGRLEAALSTAINALADARPEKWPLTYLGRWLLEQGAKEGETPPVGEVDAQSEVPEALRPLQKRAAEALGPIKPATASEGDDEHAVKLPEALITFKTLAKTEAIEAACDRLHGLELNVVHTLKCLETVERMGCENSKMEAFELSARDSERDPRWDVEGFSRWAEACQLAWIRVGYLRELKELGKPIPYQQLAPKGSLWIGVPPPDVQLYAISPYTWLGEKGDRKEWLRQPTDNEQMHSDPHGFLLQHMVEYLNEDGALDDDLALMFHISAWCFAPTEREVALWDAYKEGSIYINTHYRIKCVPVCEVPEGFPGEPVLERMWGIHEFFLSAYCQRIVNATAPLIKPNLTPEKLRGAHELLKSAPCISEPEREKVLRLRHQAFSRMLPARKDAVGFQTVCEQSGFRWVFVWFVQELAARRVGGPAPRCQDLPYGTYVEGRVPEGVRHYVVSHGWAAR